MSSRRDARRLRVCALTRIVPQHGVRGGMERHLELVGRGLRACGHDVTVLTTSHPDGRGREETDWGTVHFLPGMRPGAYWPRWFRGGRDALMRLHAEKTFDLVLSEGAAAESYARAKADETLPPLVSFMHGTLWGEVENHRHALHSPSNLRHTLRYLPPLLHHAFFWRSYVREADLLIAASRAVRARIEREYRVDRSRIEVVPNGIDAAQYCFDPTSREQIREQAGVRAGEDVLMTVGRLVPEKGVHIAIEALARVIEAGRSARMIIVGDGPQRRELHALVAARGLAERVVFAGLVAGDRIPQYVSACDVFLLPTLRHEGMPFTLLESMSCGRPSVVARFPGVEEVIRHGEDALVVEPGDPQEMAGGIVELLRQPSFAESISRNARSRIERHYGLETMVRRTIDLLEQCASRMA